MYGWIGASGRRMAAWLDAAERERAKRLAGWLLLAATIALAATQLRAIGWRPLVAAHPTAPGFYVLAVLGYLLLPVADTQIYRGLWGIGFWRWLCVFMRKRIYNSLLIGYSGEVYLLLQARGWVDREGARLAHDIKDVNVLSAMVSSVASAGLLLYVLCHASSNRLFSPALKLWVVATLVIAASMPLLLAFRTRLMTLPRGAALAILAVHAVRFVGGQLVFLAQCVLVMPQVGWSRLASLLAVQVLVGRIPMVPNRDLLFIGMAVALSGQLALPRTALASLLVVNGALQLAMHLAVLIAAPLATARHRQGTAS
jgi:hypothetical protein